jgi:hypothetical protein
MRSDEFDAFSVVIKDLCAAYDRPATEERVRVFWEDLRYLHLLDVKRSAEAWRRSSRKMPTPIDLKPERVAAPPPKDPIESESWSSWAMAANQILLAVAYFDERRGFRSMATWEPTPERGWGLPLRRPKLIDGALLDKCLAIKRDFVQMAEQDEARGAPWEPQEFNRACREAFEQALGTVRTAA